MSQEITVQLRQTPETTTEPVGDAGVPRELVVRVEGLGGRVRPLHPGTRDPALARYLLVEAAGPEERDRLLDALRRDDLVEAAYVKPADEPP